MAISASTDPTLGFSLESPFPKFDSLELPRRSVDRGTGHRLLAVESRLGDFDDCGPWDRGLFHVEQFIGRAVKDARPP